MLFAEEIQQMSQLLRISADLIVRIASERRVDQDQLDMLAVQVDAVADRLMKIGSRTGSAAN